jgi:hypothetical protein
MPGAVCHACGAAHHAWASSRDGDSEAVDDLTRQARRARPEMARILRIMRDRIRTQASIARDIERGLASVYRDAIEALRDTLDRVPGRTVAERARRIALDAESIGAVLERASAPTRAEVTLRQAELAELARDTVEAGGIPRAPSVQGITAAATQFDSAFWDATIIQPRAEAMMEGLRTAILAEPLDVVVARIAERLDASIPQAVTEARTQIAEYDRAVTASVAEETGADLYFYTGPVDGITRPFCSELVGHVFTSEQVARLDNSQTDASPIFSGGGYNCRHAWAPVSEALVDALSLPRGTDEQVDAANARAAKGR